METLLMAELFRFRCFNCQKLMGAPASKFGKKAHCPRCGVELIVPIPEDTVGQDEPEDEEEENPDAVDLGALGVDLTAPPPRKLAPTSLRDAGFIEPASNPIAFLESAPAAPEEESANEEGDSPAPEESVVPIDLKTPVAPLTERRPRVIAEDNQSRRRDVILPRTAAIAWAMSSLLGIGFAFIAGMLIGHYLWR